MVNRVILVGNLGKDPEVRTLENGTKVANFSLATSDSYKDKSGQRVKKTEWHNIVVWRGLVDVVENYLRKGNMVYIEGKIQNMFYDDNDGNKRYISEVVVDNLTMLGTAQHKDEIPAKHETPTYDSEKDDLPF